MDEAAVREAREETGLDVKLIKLVGVYSDPARDPRGHVVSITYLAEDVGGELKAGTDAVEAKPSKGSPRGWPSTTRGYWRMPSACRGKKLDWTTDNKIFIKAKSSNSILNLTRREASNQKERT